MDYFKVYDKICRVLQQYTQVNNANMFRLTDPISMGIKKNNELIVFITLHTISHKQIPARELNEMKNKYPQLTYYIQTEGNSFLWYNYETRESQLSQFEDMMAILKNRIIRIDDDEKDSNESYDFHSLSQLSLMEGIEWYSFGGKDILIYDDHRTILDVIFEAHKINYFDGVIPNIITFDYHEDCCPVLPKTDLLRKIGVVDLKQASSRQFWSFVNFDLSKVDDDWISAAQKLNLAKDVVIIGNEANNNVDNNKPISEDNQTEYHIYSIPHLSFSLGNRGCLGDSFITEPYYEDIRDCLGYKDGSFNPTHPFILDFDLDCFSTICREHIMAWPEQLFVEEFIDNNCVYTFVKQMIQKAAFITICREPGCCGGNGESFKILRYLDKYFFNNSLKTTIIR